MKSKTNIVLMLLMLIVLIMFTIFGFHVVKLVKFRECYDNAFQDEKCKKYIDY